MAPWGGKAAKPKPHAVPGSHQASCWLHSKVTHSLPHWRGRGLKMQDCFGVGRSNLSSDQKVGTKGGDAVSSMQEALGSILRITVNLAWWYLPAVLSPGR